MMRKLAVLLFLCLVPSCGQAARTSAAYPDKSTAKVSATPDFTQTDPEGGFAGGGSQYGGPVAVSNSLMYLAERGYGRLLPNGLTGKWAQIAMIKALASKDFMKLDLTDGCSAEDVLRGVRGYVTGAGYAYAYLGYIGWRPVAKQYSEGVATPDVGWMKQIISNDAGAVWINIGFYTYDSGRNEYSRLGGQWLTLVGYGVDAQERNSPATLIVHDPSSRDGMTAKHNYVALSQIKNGVLKGDNIGLPCAAGGYLMVTDGLEKKAGADCIIIDGAVGLVLAK